MTRTAVARGPETDALLAVISAALLLVGDARKPAGGGFGNEDTTQPFTGYAVLYQGVTTRIDGPSSDPDADTVAEYQVTSIGLTRVQASWVADNVRAALLSAALTVPGRSVQLVEWASGLPATRDDDVVPPLFYAIDMYAVTSSPA